MTKISVNVFKDTFNGKVPISYRVTARPAVRQIIDGSIITRNAKTYEGLLVSTFELTPTNLGEAWMISILASNDDEVSGYYKIPDVEEILFTDLIEVDPETLEPDAEPEPEWWAVSKATIQGGVVDTNGDLILTRSDGVKINAGHVQGEPGKDGASIPGKPGAPGAPGIGFAGAELTPEGDLNLIQTTGDIINVGRVVGSDGEDGADDSDVATYINDSESETATALSAVIGDITGISVKAYGAVGDGIADDTAAIQAAADAVFAKSPDAELYIPLGKYKITDEVVIRCGIRASEASIYYYGTGTALQLGAVGMSMTRKRLSLPRVHQWTNGYKPTSTDGTSIGVKAINLISCDLIIPFVQFFDTNVILYGTGAGFGYNTVYLQSLWGGRRGLVIDSDVSGWANQNLILGGRISPLTQPDRYEDSSYVEVNGNSNTFLGTSLEGEDVTRYRAIISSRYNRFINCRWERTGSVGGNPRVLYRTGARANSIQGGYNAVNLEEVWESPDAADSVGGRIDDNGAIYASANSVSATTVPSGTQVDITSWDEINGRRSSYDPATGEFTLRPGRWRIDANISFNANAAGHREVKILNGTTHEDIVRVPGGSTIQSVKVSATVTAVPGKKIKIAVYQNSGAPLDLITTRVYCNFKAEYQRVEG